MTKIDDDLFDLVYYGALGWAKLFCQAQECLRDVMKHCVPDIPDDLYLKCLKLVNIEELPKKYRKESENG